MMKQTLKQTWKKGLCSGLFGLFLCAGAAAADITIDPVDSQMIAPNGSLEIPLAIHSSGDAAAVRVLANAQNTALFHDDGVYFEARAGQWILHLTPAANEVGSSPITILAWNDARERYSVHFTVTVSAPATFASAPAESQNHAPTIGAISDQTIQEDGALQNMALTVDDADGVDSLSVVPSWTKSTLFPTGSIRIEKESSQWRLSATPSANEFGTCSVNVQVSDGQLSASKQFTIRVEAVEDHPKLTGVSDFNAESDDPTFALMPNATITDADVRGGEHERYELSVEIVSGQEVGEIIGDLSMSGTLAEVQAALRKIQYNPNEMVSNVGEINEVNYRVTLVDSDNQGVSSHTFSVIVERVGRITAVNMPPVATLSISPAVMDDKTPMKLFTAGIQDSGGSAMKVSLSTPDDPTGVFGTFSPANPSFTGTSFEAKEYIRNVYFLPHENVVTNSQEVMVRLTVEDSDGGIGTAEDRITIREVNDSPTIGGISTAPVFTDDTHPVAPFPNISIFDPDRNGNGRVSVSVTIDPDLGELSPAVPAESMTSQEATAFLRTIQFVPNATAVPIGERQTATLTVRVTDSQGAVRSNSQANIAIAGMNGPPVFKGSGLAVMPKRVSPSDPRPFDQIWIDDDEPELNLSLEIRMDNANKGQLTSSNDGFVSPEAGIYSFSGTVVEVSNLLERVQFKVNPNYLFPQGQPGSTRFTIIANDHFDKESTQPVDIVLAESPRNIRVTTADDTLEVGSLRYALSIAAPNDIITFALPSYPAIVRLKEPLTLDKHLSLKGPGANWLTLSGDRDGDGIADHQLFRVEASVFAEGITFANGGANAGGAMTGGAFFVGPAASLTLQNCVVRDCVASQWGGAIDVFRGELHVADSLFVSNRTEAASGQGGGAISLYATSACSLENTTFSGNVQGGKSGKGGGALYAENSDAQLYFDLAVNHCTFSGNRDDAGLASSMLANGEGTRIAPQNSIFADEQGRNLQVIGGGAIRSQGGNLSDDSTYTDLSIGGAPNQVYLLGQETDQRERDAKLAPLALRGGSTPVHALLAESPAIDAACANCSGADQRGMFRDSKPDCGAVEYGAVQRLLINEIQPLASHPFIELYVPREALTTDLSQCSLLVDGQRVGTFAANTTVVPGSGLILASAQLSGVPADLLVVFPALTLSSRGCVQLVNSNGLTLASASYNADFVDLDSPSNLASYPGNSLTLSPQFSGCAFLPHSSVGGGTASPGADTDNTPFGADNANPVANDDVVELREDMPTLISVLDNDRDADRSDVLVVTGVSDQQNVVSSLSGATYWVQTNQLGFGEAVGYDPRASTILNALPAGVELRDSLTYQIADFGAGSIGGFEAVSDSPQQVRVLAAAHRLSDGDSIQIEGTSHYDGTHSIHPVDSDQFVIDVPYVENEVTGSWMARNPRGNAISSATLDVTIIGANDFPAPQTDTYACNEEELLRIFADPHSEAVLDGVNTAAANLLANDVDVDTDDDSSSLRVVGVVDQMIAIESYRGTVDQSPVSVVCSAHGLRTGDEIVISGYGGHPSYNGKQIVTVLDENTFTIPVLFVDHADGTGAWGRLDDGSRLSATSALGASVTLDIRADRAETHLIYNPRESKILNAISAGNQRVDSFYYAVADSHDAISLGRVEVAVSGLNEPSDLLPDPNSLAVLNPWVGTNAWSDVLRDLTIVDAAGARANRRDVRVYAKGSDEAHSVVLDDVWMVRETDVLDILCADLLANDSDPDSDDTLQVVEVLNSDQSVAVNLHDADHIQYDAAGSSAMNRLAQGEWALDFFWAVVSDGHGGRDTNVVAVLVEGVNDTPVSSEDRIVIKEDAAPFHFDPRTGTYSTSEDYDIDINGQAPDNRLWVVPSARAMSPREGFYEITNNAVVYEPALSTNYLNLSPGASTNCLDGIPFGKTLRDSFDYTISDQSFVFAENDLFRVAADGSEFVLDVLANDRNYNVRGGALQIEAVGVPTSHGAVRISGQTLTYTPAVNFVGDETFTYTVSDPWGNSARARVTVRVSTELFNGALQANDDAFSVAFGESVVLPVLANDNTRPNSGDDLIITRLLTDENQAHIELVNHQIRYVQTDRAVHSETFRYEVAGHRDGTARAVAEVTVHIVDRTNQLPVQNDHFAVPMNCVAMPLDVTANDYILPIERAYKIVSIQAPTQGVVSNDLATGQLFYSAPSNFIGQVTLGYTVSDQLGGSGAASVSLWVGMPVAEADSYTLPIDTQIHSLAVLANDRIYPSTAGSVRVDSVSGAAENGSVSVVDGQLRFTGNGTAGESLVHYTVSDGARDISASVRIRTVSDGLYANADTFHVLQNSEPISLNVLTNDLSLPHHRPMTITAVGLGSDGPNHSGSVTRSDDSQSLIYAPAPGFVGEESFTYTMTDAHGSNTARVTVRVTAPVAIAADDIFAVYHEGASTGAFTLPVLENDILLPDRGGELQIVSVGINGNQPNRDGSVRVSSDRHKLIYQPNTSYVATESYTEQFTYELSDGTAVRKKGTVQVMVYPRREGRLPECNADRYSVARNSRGNVLPVLENDGIRPDGTDHWTLRAVSDPLFGGHAVISGSTLLYTPAPNFTGTDSLTYTVNDGLGSTKTATVQVRVGSLLLNEDQFVVQSSTSSNELSVLLNDGVLPGPEFALQLDPNSVSAAVGSVVVTSNRLFYTPASEVDRYPYEDTLEYGVLDDSGQTQRAVARVLVVERGSDLSTSTVIFTVEGVNDAPVLHQFEQQLQTTDKEPLVAFPAGAVSDVDEWGEELLRVRIELDSAEKGQLTSLGGFVQTQSGTYEVEQVTPVQASQMIQALVFEPSENRIPVSDQSESTLFTIRVWDPFVEVPVVAHQQIDVISVNDTPKPQPESYQTDEDTPLSLFADRVGDAPGLLTADWDPDVDDGAANLTVKGVFLHAHPIQSYEPAGSGAVRVTSPNHGLRSGTQIVIAGYGGYDLHDRYSWDCTYNQTHAVTVIDSDHFTIPIAYVDNDVEKGAWALRSDVLSPTGRSAGDALVRLDLGADRSQTRVVYDPSASQFLQTLAVVNDQPDRPGFTSYLDQFYYAVADKQGRLSFQLISVDVDPVNDAPELIDDPSGLQQLSTWTNASAALSDVIDSLSVLYARPGARANWSDVGVEPAGTQQHIQITDLWSVREDQLLSISSADLLANDSDVDSNELYRVSWVQPISQKHVAVALSADGQTVLYDAASAASMNALSRGERVVDSFAIAVADDNGAVITNTVAVLVIGVNDQPVAVADQMATDEDTAKAFNPLRWPSDDQSAWDSDVDQNQSQFDDQLWLVERANQLSALGAAVTMRDGTIAYDPAPSDTLRGLPQNGVTNDTFRYTVVDQSSLFANDDEFVVDFAQGSHILNVLANDRNLNARGGSYSIETVTTCSAGGRVSIQSDGSALLYTPAENSSSEEELFAYTLRDEWGRVDTARVLVRSAASQSVALAADSFTVLSDEVSVALAVLDNDGNAVLQSVRAPDAGGSALVSGSTVLYTPAADHAGGYPYVESFQYVSDAGQIGSVSVTVIEKNSDASTASVSVEVAGVNDAPVLTNFGRELQTDDETPLTVFADTRIVEYDEWGLETLTVRIELDDASKGALSQLGSFDELSAGVYEMQGTAEQISQSLKALAYVPVANRIVVGTDELVRLNVSVRDPFVNAPVTAWLDVRVTPVNQAPQIEGTRADQTLYHSLRIKPFAGVSIREVDDRAQQSLRVRVVLSDASHGVLTDLGPFADLGGGVYSVAGITAEAATAALRKLQFEPMTAGRVTASAPSEQTRFAIEVDDAFAPLVRDDRTTVWALFSLTQRVESPWGSSGNPEQYGAAVGSLRDVIAVGSPRANGHGVVTLYQRDLGGADAWGELLSIEAPNATGSDLFGAAIVMHEDTLVVGAPAHGAAGAAYIFQRNQGGDNAWGLVTQLVADHPSSGAKFGCAVDLDGDRVAVGASHASLAGSASGGVYLFERNRGGSNQWGLSQVLTPSDGRRSTLFGRSIALDGDVLVAGAPQDSQVSRATGAAYIFEYQGGAWAFSQKLLGDPAGSDDWFGYAVDVSEDVVAVGAPMDSDGIYGYGAAYLFSKRADELGHWQLERILKKDHPHRYDLFGDAISLDRGVLAVGARGYGDVINVGEVYLYGRNESGVHQWGSIESLQSPSGRANESFGAALALNRHTLAVCSFNSREPSVSGHLSVFNLKFNNAPVVAQPIASQTIPRATPFEMSIPDGTFSDPDSDEALQLHVVFDSGALQSGFSFDPATKTLRGTPTQTGTFSVQVIAEDADHLFATNAFDLIVVDAPSSLSPKERWIVEHFGEAALAGLHAPGMRWSDGADADGDGMSNLDEYLFGSNPVFANAGDNSAIALQSSSEDGWVELVYCRRRNDASIRYELEHSNNLATWSRAESIVRVKESRALSAEVEQVVLRIHSDDAVGFFRVRVDY